MTSRRVATNLHVLGGAAATGVLVCDGRALLIDCCDSVTPERLAEIGVESVEMILLTQHRRANSAGAARYVDRGARLVVPAGERRLVEDPADYWGRWKNRWHLYHHQPGPQVPARPTAVHRGVTEGDVVEWRGHSIRVLDTPGSSDGAVSYLLDADGRTIAFCGDAMAAPGQLGDLYSLQKGHGGIRDYHGFIGNHKKLILSLRKLAGCGAEMLVGSSGAEIDAPPAAAGLLIERLEALWRNYTAISCLNYYFPDLFAATADDPLRMTPAETLDPPEFVFRRGTTRVVVSAGGAALAIDAGRDGAVEWLRELIRDGEIRSVDACWVTHHHDDHVDSLWRMHHEFGCPIVCDEHLAEVIAHPSRFFLPCISSNAAPVARATRDGESWQWKEFTLTAFHLPGQTYYHGGLLVEGRGRRLFFAGDSGSPTGIDDHCCPNRVLLGEGLGFRRCFDIWRQTRPEMIFNQHQPAGFRFSHEQLDYMERLLVERERMIGEMTPWENVNFALDEWWVRTFPYQQEAVAGQALRLDVRFTNHAARPVDAGVEPVLPPGWLLDRARSTAQLTCPPRTDGAAAAFCDRPDAVASVWITVDPDAAPGQYVIPVRVTWDGRYLGPFRTALIVIR